MDILFASGRLEKMCNDHKLAVRRLGDRRARLLGQRLAELQAAEVLEHIRPQYLPAPRCHELREDLAGKLSVDLDYPYRLLFEPANEPVPRKPDGGLDWTGVTAIRALRIEDTHG